MNLPPSRLAGFTLIELMVTLSVAAVLMMFAVPGMQAFRRNAELTSATNDMLVAINMARSEAMKRGTNAVVKPVTGTDWGSGIRVFADTNANDSLDAGEVLLLEQAPSPSYLTLTSNNATSVAFTAAGFLKKSGLSGPSALTIQRNDGGTDVASTTRLVIVSLAGRVRSCKPVSASDPLCKAS